jgi:hypothetical protein
MDFRRLNKTQLADFAKNIKEILAGPELSAIDSNVKAGLLAALGTLPEILAEQAAEALIAEGLRKAAVSAKNGTRAVLTDLLVQIRNTLKATAAPKGQFVLCNFDYPFTPLSMFVPDDPTDLSVTGSLNGVNRGRFAGHNTPGRATYEIWRRAGRDGQWLIHTTTKRQSFIDRPVTPGQFYEYRIRAVAARAVSNFSNSAIVYGIV